MSEIKLPIEKLKFGETVIAGHDNYLITEDHTIADIARWVHREGWTEDLLLFLSETQESV